MLVFWIWQAFWLGVAVSLGCMSFLASQFGGAGHVPRLTELPGIALSNLLDRVPNSIVTSTLWPGQYVDRLEASLDYYQCPSGHEYRVEIVHHAPLIIRLRGFLPPGEATHLLKLAYSSKAMYVNGSDSRGENSSYVSQWTKDDPTRMYLEPDEDRVVACLEARIASISGYSIHHQEAIQIVRNSGERGLERPEDNLWPEWQPFDTSTTKRIARMLIALDTVSTDAWDIEFPSIKRIFSIKKNDALFWWNLTPDGDFDERILHKISTNEEIWSANVFINEGFWRPSWWEAS